MKLAWWIAAACVYFSGATAMADLPAPNPSQYTNVDYQSSVRLPRGFPACVGEVTNHGVVILLDMARWCDGNYFDGSAIFVNADYNAAGDADTAWGLAEIECRWQMARRIVWLHGQMISGRAAAGCRRLFDDGRLEVTYIVLRKTGRSPLSWIEISADLITTPARYEKDMRVFRRVLPGIWVHPDGPHY